MNTLFIDSENSANLNSSLIEKTDEESRKVEEFIRAGISKKSLFASRADHSQVAVLTRAVMRHPVSEGREMLYLVHENMRARFSSLSDEALGWLLGGSCHNAQGGFKDVTALREFLQADPKAISSSRLINGTETVLTAIGYRLIRASYGIPPFIPETEEQKKMDEVLQEIKSGYFAPPINAAYPQRMKEGAAQFDPGQYAKTTESNLIGFPEEELSDPSDDEKKAVKQPKRLHGRVLKTLSPWTNESLEKNVEARAHVSGTAPVVLASALGLCRADKSNPAEIENMVSFLGGIVVIPTFDRGDYHSVAEAYAGRYCQKLCFGQ